MSKRNLPFLCEDEDDICLQDLFDESSSSSDEDEDRSAAFLQSNYRIKRICIKNFHEVIENYSEEDFIKHFRLRRDTVGQLITGYEQSQIYKELTKHENSRAFQISPQKTILVFLWYAGHQTASFRDVSDRFDLCLKSLHDIITRVCNYLGSIAVQYIRWPTQEEMFATKEFYFNKKGFVNIIGSMDGTHIKIDKPVERHVDYYNRKHFYSIVLQGVCNHRKQFINIFVGFAGSTHDARVFKCSTLFEKVERSQDDFHILADSAYPLSTHIITPYKDNGHLTAAQKYFNTQLSSCRVDIEHTFGLLKQRFRQLYHLKLQGHQRICNFIRACCVLHNIGGLEDFEILNSEEPILDDQPESPETITIANSNSAGNVIRNQLCQQLYNNKK